MEPEIKGSMLAYYDARANEYDELYCAAFPGSTERHRQAYVADAAALKEVARRFSHGSLLDAPCGTAFWLPAYAQNVARITLVDLVRRRLNDGREFNVYKRYFEADDVRALAAASGVPRLT